MEQASFNTLFYDWLGGSELKEEGQLLGIEEVAAKLGVPAEDDTKFHLSIEEYLSSIITMINELSRLAVNSVTLGNYSRPVSINRFINDLHNGFQLLNLKNDQLRRRFDSVKYDLKKVEESMELSLLRWD